MFARAILNYIEFIGINATRCGDFLFGIFILVILQIGRVHLDLYIKFVCFFPAFSFDYG